METHRHTHELPQAATTGALRDPRHDPGRHAWSTQKAQWELERRPEQGVCGQDQFQGGRGLSGRERERALEGTSLVSFRASVGGVSTTELLLL